MLLAGWRQRRTDATAPTAGCPRPIHVVSNSEIKTLRVFSFGKHLGDFRMQYVWCCNGFNRNSLVLSDPRVLSIRKCNYPFVGFPTRVNVYFICNVDKIKALKHQNEIYSSPVGLLLFPTVLRNLGKFNIYCRI